MNKFTIKDSAYENLKKQAVCDHANLRSFIFKDGAEIKLCPDCGYERGQSVLRLVFTVGREVVPKPIALPKPKTEPKLKRKVLKYVPELDAEKIARDAVLYQQLIEGQQRVQELRLQAKEKSEATLKKALEEQVS